MKTYISTLLNSSDNSYPELLRGDKNVY